MTLDTSRDRVDCPDVPDGLDSPDLEGPRLEHMAEDKRGCVSIYNDADDRYEVAWIVMDAEHAVELPYC